jgi:Ca2+-binding EF-hand superfamily protein
MRKSIAYSPPRRDGFPYQETTGQTSSDFNLHNNNSIYQAHVQATQKEQNFAASDPSKAGYHSQKELLLKKIRTSLNRRGIRGFITLKRQFKVLDAENRGYLTLNEFLQAFDDMKISNIPSGDLNMIFGIYDLKKECQINYNAFLWNLYEELSPVRLQMV